MNLLAYIPRRIIDAFAFRPQGVFYTAREPWLADFDGLPVMVCGPTGEVGEPALDTSKKVLLFMHGNMSCLASAHPRMLSVATALRVNVVAMEYRGYGLYGYKRLRPSAGACVEDAVRVIGHLVGAKGFLQRDVIVVGHSIGTGIAAAAVRAYPVMLGGLVLISPYRSLISVLSKKLAALAWWCDSLATERIIRAISCPVMIVHGTGDQIIPYDHGAHLAALIERDVVRVENAQHNDMMLSGYMKTWVDEVRRQLIE